ncbi:hypothetical protein HaLaN_08340, partial [Haematococcus lacustris]
TAAMTPWRLLLLLALALSNAASACSEGDATPAAIVMKDLASEDEQQGTFLGFEELCDLSAAAGPLPGSPAQARPHRQRAAGGPAKAGSAPPRLQLDLLRLLAGDGGQAAGQQRRLNSSVLAKVEDAPGPCAAVASQLNRATGFAILSTNASRTRGTCISHAVLAAAVQVCTQAGHFGVKALDTQAADKSGGVAGDDCGSDGSSFHADGYGQSAWRSSDEHAAPAAGNTSSLDAGPMLVRALGVVRGQLVLDQQLWAHPCQESPAWEAR